MTTDVINGVPRELKPCPFCGGEAERFTLQDEENFGGDVIACKKCEACTRVVFGEKEGLIESWNRRTLLATAQPTADGEREAFEAWAASVGYHTERDMFQREKYQSSLTWELWRVWQARAAQPQQAVAGEHDPMRQLANTYKATAMMRAYEVRRLREALTRVGDRLEAFIGDDRDMPHNSMEVCKGIIDAALSAHKTGEEE